LITGLNYFMVGRWMLDVGGWETSNI